MATIEETNSKIVDSVTNFQIEGLANAAGWIFFILLIIGGACIWFWWYWNKKQYSQTTTDFEIIGNHYEPSFKDQAKNVKLGSGGFRVLYLKKLKTWRIAHGGKVGKNNYYFFIGKDGYPYNSVLSAEIYTLDQNKGLVPVVTTNPTMRAQYTALEKQIEALHGDKKGFWDKYGNWVMSIGFIVIIGVFAWLIFREMSPLMSQFTGLTEKLTILADRVCAVPTAETSGSIVKVT